MFTLHNRLAVLVLALFFSFQVKPCLAKTPPVAASAQLSPALLAKSNHYHEVKLSPDGQHLAVVATQKKRRVLLVFSTQDFSVVGDVAFSNSNHVGSVSWVSAKRLVIKVYQSRPWIEELQYFGELYGVNLDGSRGKLLFGYRMNEQMANQVHTRTKPRVKRVSGYAELVDLLKEDKAHVLISATRFFAGKRKLSKLYKLNVYSGELQKYRVTAPTHHAKFITDQQANLRFVSGLDENNSNRAFWFEPNDNQWRELESAKSSAYIRPLAFDKTGEWLYLLQDLAEDKSGLYKLSAKTGERQKVYVDPNVDISEVLFKAEGNGIYGLLVDDGYPAYILTDPTDPEAQVFKLLLQVFQGKKISITSQSNDGSKLVVAVSSDVMPQQFYLYDTATSQLVTLFDNFNGIQPALISPSKAIQFSARDGTTIHGYFSRPQQVDPKQKVPMVTLVHGGPHGERDYWRYNREVQLLSSLGYAVLRVNYRGSGGYGRAFQEAGYRQWGHKVQHDIIDGTRWAIANHQVNKNKVCIMGTSFGAYSAVQSATIEPELFRCVVANAGVYDLGLLYQEGALRKLVYGESYLRMAMGTDAQQLKAFSPAHRVHLLKAPMLLAHGEKDERAPFEHAERLAQAMNKNGNVYEWFVRAKETHGFYNDANRTAYFEKVAGFLQHYL